MPCSSWNASARISPRPNGRRVAKLSEVGGCSQNFLGRLTAMDAATIKGVVDRLMKRGYIESTPSATDRRRVLITLTAAGKKAYERGVGARFGYRATPCCG